MAFTTTQVTIAGVVILIVIAAATVWWTVRAIMGWHSGRALYWLGEQRADDEADDDDDSDADNTGTNSP